jgi:hypothetical protein
MAKGKPPKDKQYNGQRKNDKRTNNIKAKGKPPKDKPFVVFFWPLYYLSFGGFPLAFVLFVLLSFSFSHYIVCPLVVFLWTL